jgi:aspartate aminotransferase
MFAPGEPFYKTPGKGRNEIRIAYVLKQEDLERAMELLAKGIEAYNNRK